MILQGSALLISQSILNRQTERQNCKQLQDSLGRSVLRRGLVDAFQVGIASSV